MIIDNNPCFTYYHIDCHVEDVLELEEIVAAQGSTSEILLLNVGVRFGTWKREAGENSVVCGLRSSHLKLKLKNCRIVRGSRLDNHDVSSTITVESAISKTTSNSDELGAELKLSTVDSSVSLHKNKGHGGSETVTEIVQQDKQLVRIVAESGNKWSISSQTIDPLSGLVLGHDNLCKLTLEENYSVHISLLATSADIQVSYVDGARVLSEEKKAILRLLERKGLRYDAQADQLVFAEGMFSR